MRCLLHLFRNQSQQRSMILKLADLPEKCIHPLFIHCYTNHYLMSRQGLQTENKYKCKYLKIAVNSYNRKLLFITFNNNMWIILYLSFINAVQCPVQRSNCLILLRVLVWMHLQTSEEKYFSIILFYSYHVFVYEHLCWIFSIKTS